jgi:hypothetical protein
VEELWQARQFLNAGVFRRIPSTTMFSRRRISRDLGEFSVCQDLACGSLSSHRGYSEPRMAEVEETPAAGPPWQAVAAQEDAPRVGWFFAMSEEVPQDWLVSEGSEACVSGVKSWRSEESARARNGGMNWRWAVGVEERAMINSP